MNFQISLSEIPDGIRSGNIKVAIIGLGEIGLLLAIQFGKEGASVTGVDIDEQKVSLINRGTCPIDHLAEAFSRLRGHSNLQATSDATRAVESSHIHILCLPTPLDKDRLPDLSAILTATKAVGRGLKKGDLVILESSVYPGVTNRIVRNSLEESSGLRAGEDFRLAYCFERIDPGNTEHRLDNTPKIVGAVDEDSANAAVAVYGVVVKEPVIKVGNCETAEMVKLVENVYRDVNIAFVNEIALLCQRLNVDVLEVLDAASAKWNFIPHLPGPVGGTCIPINPYYLLESAQEAGMDLKLVRQAREVNESMPHHMVELITEALDNIDKPIKDSKICVLGLAYKGDIADTRGAPAEEIIRELERLGAEIICHDPVVTQAPDGIVFESSFEEAVKGSDCVVITSDHSSFQSLDLRTMSSLAHTPLALVDGRHVVVPREAEALGITYIGLGRKHDSRLNIWNSGLKAKGQKGKGST